MTVRRSPAVPSSSQWSGHGGMIIAGRISAIWRNGCIRVLSSAGDIEYRGIVSPHNHVSVSVDPRLHRRPSNAEMALVRKSFDMEDAEEDNHQPGRIRNLFLPLHLPRGTVGVCDCKEGETQVVEPDGFVWSRTKREVNGG